MGRNRGIFESLAIKRSTRLGVVFSLIKTHSRRRALPTILANMPEVSEISVRALGRWTFTAFAHYVTMSEATIGELQERALKKAERDYPLDIITPSLVFNHGECLSNISFTPLDVIFFPARAYGTQ